MLNLRDCAGSREDHRKMTLPSRRVITLRAMTADDGPIEHSLDAGANPVRSLVARFNQFEMI